MTGRRSRDARAGRLYGALLREPQRLAVIEHGSWTNPIWEQIRDRQSQIVESAFAWSAEQFDLSERGETDFVEGAYASGGIFGTLGLSPPRGRLFTPADDVRGAAAQGGIAVVSYGFWQRRFGGGPDVVGRTIGAEPGRVVRLVLGRVAWLVAAGVVGGGAVSLWAAQYTGSLLFGLTSRDPATFAGGALVLVGVGLIAAWLPARRASRIDPTEVLRD